MSYNLKPGDRVTLMDRNQPRAIRKVARLTKTLVLVEPHYKDRPLLRYRRKDGRMVGMGPYDSAHIEQATVEHRRAITRALRESRVRNLAGGVVSALTDGQLHRICEILDEKWP